MLHPRLSRSLLVLFGVGLFLSAGCGPGKGTPVSGKLIFPSGVVLEKDDQVDITFIPTDPKIKRSAVASAQAPEKVSEVQFTANTSETTGILPGSYKIVVKVTPYPGAPGSEGRKSKLGDGINKKFDSAASKLTYEVTAGPDAHTITIDLGKGTVTKN